MTEHNDLRALLRQALPPAEDRPPSRDLWPEVLTRRPPSPNWTWFDLGAAATIAILLSLFPGCLWLLLYHL
jgi:hypothetical protein